MNPLWLLTAFAGIAVAYFAGVVLIPLLFALFFAILLEPLVARLAAWGLRRNHASAAVVIAFLVIVLGGIWGASRPFSNIAGQLPQYKEKFKTATVAFERKAKSLTGEPVSASSKASEEPAKQAGEGRPSWGALLWRGLGSLAEAAGIAAFVPFLMFVMLAEKDLLIESFKRLAGASCDIGMIDRETTQMVRAYFYGNLVAGVVMAFLHWLVFLGLGLKNAVGLGLVTGLVTLVPLIGLPGALLLPVAQALLQFETVLPFVLIAVSMTAIHLFNANYFIPRVIGGSVKINSTAATIGLLFFGWLWGVTGFVLAIPLTALIKILFDSSRGTEPYARALAVRSGEPRPWFGRRWASRRGARAAAPR
ncbi:MAG TPA: AI-2E family transporter [Elusimicrobiota bacterium]|nr:AI-2E family transporter [Elusimicrobiota bacterium]